MRNCPWVHPALKEYLTCKGKNQAAAAKSGPQCRPTVRKATTLFWYLPTGPFDQLVGVCFFFFFFSSHLLLLLFSAILELNDVPCNSFGNNLFQITGISVRK